MSYRHFIMPMSPARPAAVAAIAAANTSSDQSAASAATVATAAVADPRAKSTRSDDINRGDFFEETAATLEFDQGLSRLEAEARAHDLMQEKFRAD